MKKADLYLTKTNDFCGSNSPMLTVILIHGIASDSHSYDKAIDYFKNNSDLDKIRFVSFDLLGSGKSLKSDELDYNYPEQLSALNNSIKDLNVKTPIILIGHSLGTFIVTRYACEYPKNIIKLILVSPPIYTKKDFDNPAFALGIEAFRRAVSIKNSAFLLEKAFNNSMQNIVLNKSNYNYLSSIRIPVALVYGNEDQLIASYNIPALLKTNKMISAHKTVGRHGVTRDKYTIIAKLLTEGENA